MTHHRNISAAEHARILAALRDDPNVDAIAARFERSRVTIVRLADANHIKIAGPHRPPDDAKGGKR